jgi:hypothetical protein
MVDDRSRRLRLLWTSGKTFRHLLSALARSRLIHMPCLWLALFALILAIPNAANAACGTLNVPDANTSPATSPMASGGSITITLGTLCDSFGLNPYPDATPPNTSTGPLHGTVSVQAGAGIVTYTNNGDGATSDSFVLTDASDHPFTINVTIAAPTSPISVSPSSLPTPNVGVPYSQPLSASGGHVVRNHCRLT